METETGCITVTVAVMVLLLGALIYGTVLENRHDREVCAKLLHMAKTTQDTMTVIMRCDLSKPVQHTTTVVPVYIR